MLKTVYIGQCDFCGHEQTYDVQKLPSPWVSGKVIKDITGIEVSKLFCSIECYNEYRSAALEAMEAIKNVWKVTFSKHLYDKKKMEY